MKVLFVAANPLDTGRLALDEEVRAIQRKVAASPHNGRIEFVAVWAARPDDLLQAINEHQPTIIHFVGHATPGGLVAVGEDRRARPIANEALLRLLALESASSVRLVMLNACYSADLAEEIERKIGCAVGMSERLDDEAAAAFSSSFFRAIGFGATIREAVEQGCTSILLEGADSAKYVRFHCDEQVALTRLLPRPDPPQNARPVDNRASVPLLDEVGAINYLAERLAYSTDAFLLFMDIDGLLGINMVYGEQIGDLVIARCCEIVANLSKRYAGACRVRGDQFLILATWNTRMLAKRDGARLIRQMKEQDWSALGRDLHVTVTAAGAYWYRERVEQPASLLLRTILGVKEAKRRRGSSAKPFEILNYGNWQPPWTSGPVVAHDTDYLSQIRSSLS